MIHTSNKLAPFRRALALIALSASLAQATPAVGHSADVAREWFSLSLELIQTTPGFSPPVASRALGYLGVALYEAVRPGMPGHRSLAGQLNGLAELPQPEAGREYHWPSVADGALYTLSRRLLQAERRENAEKIRALHERLSRRFKAEPNQGRPGQEVIARSLAYGAVVAEAIYQWSRTDGGHDAHARKSSYTPPVGAGLWASATPAVQPSWGNNRPFALKAGDACGEGSPPAYSEAPDSEFYAQALEVYQTGRTLSDEQRQIALFWSDDPGKTATPPGHWMSILTQTVEGQKLSLDRAAESYAKLGIAVADAFIGCWNLKYKYNLLRPDSYIQNVLDQRWTPVLKTPPFPEYPSGHSVQSAAAAGVLTQLFGEDFSFVDRTHAARGVPERRFGSFAQAAQEAAVSRLYGGIHFRAAIEDGLAQGRCIGETVAALEFHEHSH